MAKQKSKRLDLNQLAASIVERTTDSKSEPPAAPKKKNAAAVALGRRGGLKGGKARAESLSASRRKAIAKRAAAARWTKHKK
jgi:hypothetical protein